MMNDIVDTERNPPHTENCKLHNDYQLKRKVIGRPYVHSSCNFMAETRATFKK